MQTQEAIAKIRNDPGLVKPVETDEYRYRTVGEYLKEGYQNDRETLKAMERFGTRGFYDFYPFSSGYFSMRLPPESYDPEENRKLKEALKVDIDSTIAGLEKYTRWDYFKDTLRNGAMNRARAIGYGGAGLVTFLPSTDPKFAWFSVAAGGFAFALMATLIEAGSVVNMPGRKEKYIEDLREVLDNISLTYEPESFEVKV